MKVFLPALVRLWNEFSKHEKKLGFGVLAVMIVTSASSVLMVGSIMPFLYVLSNPEVVDNHWFFIGLSDFFGGVERETIIFVLGIGVFLAVVFSNLLGLLRVYVIARYAQMRGLSLSRKMFGNMMRQPYEKYTITQPGIFMRRCVSEPVQSVTGFLMPCIEAISALFTATFMVSFLAWYNLWVTLFVIGFVVFSYFLMAKIIGSKLRVLGKIRVEAVTARSQVIQEVFRCFRDIRLSSQEAAFEKRFNDYSRKTMETQIQSQFWAGFPRYWIQMLFFGGVVFGSTALILIGGDNAQDVLLESLPTIGLFVLAGQRLLPEVQIIYNSRNKMTFGLASVEALFEGIDEAKDFPPSVQAPSYRKVPSNSITLKDVEYMYTETSSGIPGPFNFSVKVGEHVGIVGESGSGKSTLACLLMGLIEPQKGQMCIDGVAVDRDMLPEWTASVAQVPQEVMLLSTDIKGNVAVGVEEDKIDEGKVWAALEKAQLADWVRSLPDGLSTNIQLGSALVSGGQKQRIGLARAFFSEAEVIVLDEATSALDDKTESEILKTLSVQLHGKTTFSIAHRLTTLRQCDRIVELSKGRIVFDGTWAEFKNMKGLSI